MRAAGYIVLLAALAVTFEARGEASTAAAGDTSCSVPADTRWSKQEIFVWERVCAGFEANFNLGADFGGNQDPRTAEGLAALQKNEGRVLSPQFIETILLNDKYRSALTRRGVRIMGARFKDKVDLENAEIKHEFWLDRSLLEKGADFSGMKSTSVLSIWRSKVIGQLVLDSFRTDARVTMNNSEYAEVDLRRARIGEYLDMDGSKVTGMLDMSSVNIAGSLYMRDGGQFAGIDLGSGYVGGTLELTRSTVTGKLNMDKLRVGSSLFMRSGAQFAEVDMGSARIGGQLSLIGAKVTGALNMDSLNVAGPVYMREGAQFAEINMASARIGGQLSLTGAKVSGKLNMNQVRVDSSLFMRNQGEFKEVVLVSANIAGQLDLGGSKFTGPLNMGFLDVRGALFMDDKGQYADVNLGSAHIGGTVDFESSTVTGKLNMDKLRVDSSVFMRSGAQFAEVDLKSSNIADQLVLDGAKVTGRLTMDSAHIGGSAFMRSGAELDEIVLRGAHINGELSFTNAKIAGPFDCYGLSVDQHVNFGRGAEFMTPVNCAYAKFKENLDLSNGRFHGNVNLLGAQIGGELIIGSSVTNFNRWPNTASLILRNARAETIPMLSDAWPGHIDVDGLTYRTLRDNRAVSSAPTDECPRGLFACWFDKHESFAPQAYEQLALVFQNQGHIGSATAIRYAGKEKERDDATGLRYAWLTALDLTIGFGHHTERAILWVVGLVLLGSAVLHISGQGKTNGMPFGISYSFDMLLPVIRLRHSHQSVDLLGWPRYYFYCHKIAGFVLASFLIAGISGLTK